MALFDDEALVTQQVGHRLGQVDVVLDHQDSADDLVHFRYRSPLDSSTTFSGESPCGAGPWIT